MLGSIFGEGDILELPQIPIGPEDAAEKLETDTKVKVAGIDIDGILRGKILSKKKFLSVLEDGFGFCSVIFGWDMHDAPYVRELKISNKENGYGDMIAKIDVGSFRRIPWEDNVPFFLVSFFAPDTQERVSACPRGLLARMMEGVENKGYSALAGAEFEFFQFLAPPLDYERSSYSSTDNSSGTALFLKDRSPHALAHLTEGMTGYSLTRPVQNQDWYYDLFTACERFRLNIESWHTESGPGVFEAALEYSEIKEMADRACLFKYVAKCVSSRHHTTPCFMAKPRHGLPGNSGHMHVSIVDKDGNNMFYRGEKDANPPYPDLAHVSDLGRHFLAGILVGLTDVMPMVAPTINSYKRLVENFWAPVTVSWGLEHRSASIRLIAPPIAPAKSTRFEIRVAGADANAHLVLAAVVGLGWRGVEKKLDIPLPPLSKGEGVGGQADRGERLAKDLGRATERMMRPGSVAREVFGDDFVDHFGGTREHEVRFWEEAVTDWEVRRYLEKV